MSKFRYRDTSDIYTYPGTDVLINNFDERDQDELDILDEETTTISITDLIENPLDGNFDFQHLKEVHKRIFEDIYPFAGEVRMVNISKGGPGFCQVMYLEGCAEDTFKKLKKENHLKGLNDEKFKERLLYYMGELNALHPFREGNGRSLREFLRELCLASGWILDYDQFNKDEILEADIGLFNGQEDKIRELFERGLLRKEIRR